MSEAAMMDAAMAFAIRDKEDTNANKPLRACVEDAMKDYFMNLEGDITNDLYQMVLSEIEEPLFRSVMEYTRGNQSKAAEMMGINRGTLRKKLKMYSLHQ
jgi:Fis family transcriptional regulator